LSKSNAYFQKDLQMTPTIALTPSARAALVARLDGLLAEYARVLTDGTLATGAGDAADRASNIEPLTRLADLENRIAVLREQLEAPEREEGAPHDAVDIGDRVVVQFSGESSSENYLVGFIEQAGPGIDVITPASPFGRAIIGRRAGDLVQFRTETGAQVAATLIDVAAA
jgi:transcription elongation factor GreA